MTVRSGQVGANITIVTDIASGIVAGSYGTATASSWNSALGIPLPSGSGGVGGVVQVQSYSDIITNGHSSVGISAKSSTTGYPDSVITALQNFDASSVTFSVTSVKGSASNIGSSVAGVLVDAAGNIVAGNGGGFTINANGTFTFNPGGDFNDLAVGQSRVTTVSYEVSPNGSDSSPSTLITKVTMTAGGLTSETEAHFDDYGTSSKPQTEGTVLPDLQGYIDGLLADATAGAAGNSVSVTSNGRIETNGDGSYGIEAMSQGGNGSKGQNSGLFNGSTEGGTGKRGGDVTVVADGSIATLGYQAVGITAWSQAGDGGEGGNGGLWWNGSRGGTGGTGGDVIVNGSATIHTFGDYASGILALSAGGNGGRGGNGFIFTGGQTGGFGGKGGIVNVEGDWDITTVGAMAHGIWAKSMGGAAGAGGSGGWILGSPGGGGEASDGGSVTINSAGHIETHGNDSYGAYGQSVGGFGGSGGDAWGIFYSSGGSGSSAGSGGSVTITNQASGSIATYGDRAHAIYGQSIGGGGGSGGGAGAIVGIGGSGGSGGEGDLVAIANEGLVETFGEYARAIYAQSIGGGGGDSGGAGGIVAIGGSGSGTSNGGQVIISNTGGVGTASDYAEAIYAQSVGGGGGSSRGSGGVVSIGGTGAGGGNGGNVSIENSGSVNTMGINSDAIVGQSVGGGGGHGGGSGGVVSVGSSGGGSGDGGAVDITNNGMVVTADANSTAIYAQSIGGGGGISSGSGGIVSLGGDGGSSGDGNAVTVINSGTVITDANSSRGILAESVGGGGGSSAVSGAMVVSFGGDGGSSGNGGIVSVTNSGLIETLGVDSGAIIAQSIGGGGGNSADSNGLGEFRGFSGSLAYSAGGKGGSAGDGGAVAVANSGAIITSGFASRGISAASIGGGGGAGGGSGSLAVSLGGDEGSSGKGGNVAVENTGTITTGGGNADGIFAQSIGGGGGSANTSGAMLYSLGGKGASGGDAGSVEVTTSNQIETYGTNSSGIFAQSVGGGGGKGANIINVELGANISFSEGIGGDGGAGGDANHVTIDSDSNIFTSGWSSRGIVAQSIGGGGGDGGSSTVTSLEANLFSYIPFALNLNISVGGNSGVSGDGSAVAVESSGNIVTSDLYAYGILAQSIGGGGGIGGNSFEVSGTYNCGNSATVAVGGEGGAAGNAGAVAVNNSGAIATKGDFSYGILGQSIGGGGGTGGNSTLVSLNLNYASNLEDISQSTSLTAVVGGGGGASGEGGAVDVVSNDAIITEGAFASGILAQSVGGGGGAGGNTSSYQIAVADPFNSLTSPFLSYSYSFILGGNGGDGGNAGVITATNSGAIFTKGAFATGILAQSVGGGGGTGGNVLTFSFNTGEAIPPDLLRCVLDLTTSSMTVAGAGGAGGNGGNVTVANSSNIVTQGAFAHGIFAQSVGGGGGFAGNSETLTLSSLLFGGGTHGVSSQVSGSGSSFAGSLGGNGSGGNVVVAQTGNITTLGDAANGIFAQSASGLLSGGTVDVTLDGNIVTDGNDSYGIFAQSGGGSWGSNISVNVLRGLVQGGSRAGAGVYIDGGADNTLTNAGNISARSGTAIVGGGGNETVNNYGTITGNVKLGGGDNALNNFSEAVLNTGSEVSLGWGALTNAGNLSPGGSGTVLTTAVTGNVAQTSSGVFAVDLDAGSDQADRLNVSGSSNLAGTARVELVNTGYFTSGSHQATILTSAEGVTDSGLTLLTEPSAMVSYELLFPNATEVQIHAIVDTMPVGLNANQQRIGAYIDRIQAAGGSASFAPFAAALLALPDAVSLAAAYDRLSPTTYDFLTTSMFDMSQQYTQTLLKRMHSLRKHVQEAGGSLREETPRYGTWVEGFGHWANEESHDGFPGFDYHLAGAALGLDYLLEDNVLAGVSYSESGADVHTEGDLSQGNIESYFGSLYASYFTGRMYVDTTLSYGQQSFENVRQIEIGDLSTAARSDHGGDLYSAYAETGYNLDLELWVLQPFAALRYLSLDEEGFRETGAGGANLVVGDRRTDALISDLGLRLARPFRKGTWLIIPELTAAWDHDFDIDDRVIVAAFEGAPTSAFAVDSREIDQDGALLGAALTLINKDYLSLAIRYIGEVRSHYDSHAVTAGMRYEF